MTIYELAEQHRAALLAGDRAAAVRMAEAYAAAFKSLKRGLVNIARDVRKRTEAKDALPSDASERKLRRAADALDRALRTDARYNGLMQQVEQQLQALGFNAAASIADQQRQAAQLSIQFAEEAAAVASGAGGAATTGAQAASNAAGVGLPWNRVPSEAVESLVGFMGDGSPLQDVFRSMAGEAADGVRQALLTGMVKGFNPEKIGRLISRATGAALERSILVARTETLRAYRVAAIDNYAANDDVVKGWRWHAHLGPGTCAACIAMHGKVYPLSVEFGSHPNCRCAPVPVTRSWEELGFGEGLPEIRPGPTGEQWLEKQGADTQRAILGSKYAAYASGEIELRDVVGYRNDRRYGPTRWEKSAKALGIDAKSGMMRG